MLHTFLVAPLVPYLRGVVFFFWLVICDLHTFSLVRQFCGREFSGKTSFSQPSATIFFRATLGLLEFFCLGKVFLFSPMRMSHVWLKASVCLMIDVLTYGPLWRPRRVRMCPRDGCLRTQNK